MKNVRDKIGIMGGSFNPIHNGHLIIANCFLDEIELDKVLFIPANVSPFKVGDKSKFEDNSIHRMNMVRLAIQNENRFELCDYEINKKEVSYSIETIQYLSEQYTDAELFLLVGNDQVKSFSKWKDWQTILSKSRLVIAGRNDEFTESEKSEIKKQFSLAGEAIFLKSPLIDISSSTIRQRIEDKKSIIGYVPNQVIKYLSENQVY